MDESKEPKKESTHSLDYAKERLANSPLDLRQPDPNQFVDSQASDRTILLVIDLSLSDAAD